MKTATIVTFLLATLTGLCDSYAVVDLRLVALGGQQAPGAPAGAIFGGFNDAIVDDFGQTYLDATLVEGSGGVTGVERSGIWSERTGILDLIVRGGYQPPGYPAGARFGSFTFNLPIPNDAGKIAFRNQLPFGGGVNSTNDVGIWSEATGPLALVAKEGGEALGTSGADFEELSISRLNNANQAIVGGRLNQGNPSNNRGIWFSENGTITNLIARFGNQAPGTPVGARFDSFIGVSAFNDLGQYFFGGELVRGPSGNIGSSNDTGIWFYQGGTLSLFARENTQAPGVPVGAVWDELQTFALQGLNSSGQLALVGRLKTGAGGVTTNDNEGIWAHRGGSFSLIVREGDQAPGVPLGTNFGNLSLGFADGLVINESGQLAFTAGLQGAGVTLANDIAMWSEGGGSLELIAREGSQAPGTPAGAMFDNLDEPAFSDTSRVAFTSLLKVGPGGVTTSTDRGIWAQNELGELELIVREGQVIEVLPGDFRRVVTLSFDNEHGFNDQGDLVFRASFKNNPQGTQFVNGVFVTNGPAFLPEPSALLLTLIAGVGFFAKRRR